MIDGFRALDFCSHPGANGFFGGCQVATGLQIHPEICAGSKEMGESQRCLGRDAPLAVQDVGNSTRRHVQPEREAIGGESAPSTPVLGVGQDGLVPCYLPSVIVGNPDRISISILESEAYAPSVVDGHRPLSDAIPFSLCRPALFRGA